MVDITDFAGLTLEDFEEGLVPEFQIVAEGLSLVDEFEAAAHAERCGVEAFGRVEVFAMDTDVGELFNHDLRGFGVVPLSSLLK